MATAATIAIKLDAQTAQLRKEFVKTRAQIKGFGDRIGKAAATFGKVSLAIGGITAALVGMRNALGGVFRTLDEIDKLQKFSDRLGINIDALQALEFAAQQTGASVETLRMGLQRMARRVAEAAAGSGEAKDALKELGIDARELTRLPLERQFATIADAIDRVESDADKLRFTFKLFDSEGVALINTMRGGSESLQAFANEAAELGLVLGDQAREVEAANEAISRASRSWDAATRSLKLALIPALKGASELVQDLAVGIRLITFQELFPDPVEIKAASDSTYELGKALRAIYPAYEKTARAVKKVADERLRLKRIELPGVGAVVAGTTAGFSAIATGQRQMEVERRWQREVLRVLSDIARLTSENKIELQPVNLS